MKEYLFIFEWAETNYSAYVPDLLGCIFTGKTSEEREVNIKEAISLYIDALMGNNFPIPQLTMHAKNIALTI